MLAPPPAILSIGGRLAHAYTINGYRGTTKTINRLHRRLKDTAADQRKATIKPTEYKNQVKTCKELDEKTAKLREQLDDLKQQEAHNKRIASALTPWLQIVAAGRELADLDVPSEFPADGGRQFANLKERRDEVADDLTNDEEELAGLQRERAEIQLAPIIVKNEAEIRRLSQKVSEIGGYERDIPKRQQESDDKRSAVTTMLSELNPDWDHTQLDQFKTSLEQRDAIERLEESRDALSQRHMECTAKKPALINDIRKLRENLEGLQQIEVTAGLDELVGSETSYRSDCDKHKELNGQLFEIDTKINALTAKLSGPFGMRREFNQILPTPMEKTVAEFRKRLGDSQEAVRRAETDVRQACTDREDRQKELQQLEAREAVPDKARLQAKRKRRDAGWSIIRRKYVQFETVGDDEASQWLGSEESSLPDSYERAVGEADRLADERQDKAAAVAQREQLVWEVGRLDERIESFEKRLSEQRDALEHAHEEWTTLWDACPFQPLSPEAMLDWLRLYDDLVDKQEHQTKAQINVEQLSTRIEEFEANLRTAFDDSADSVDRLLKRGRRAIKDDRDARTQEATYKSQLVDKEEDLKELEQQLAGLGKDQRDWQSRWQSALEQFGFPASWDVHLATKILNGLSEARGQYEQALSLDARVREMQDGVDKFRHQVDVLCQKLAVDLLDLPPESAILQLNERLDEARQAERDQAKLDKDIKRLSERTNAKQKQSKDVAARLTDLMAKAGVESEEAFQKIAAQARRHEELTSTVANAQHEIDLHRSTEDEEKFQAALEEADADAVDAALRRLKDEIVRTQETLNTASKEQLRADDRLVEMEAASEAAGLAMDLESARSELATAVDRWAPLVLAQALMRRAIDKFEREHQPAMIGDVKRLFRQLTLDRYVGVETKLDAQKTLVVEEQNGNRKEPAALSTGTREQLYLAIRLAYITHYCRDAEPLPIVMDDVLVNFDDDRAVQTLKVLQEIAANVQILFLTCHQHVVQLVQRIRPDSTSMTLAAE